MNTQCSWKGYVLYVNGAAFSCVARPAVISAFVKPTVQLFLPVAGKQAQSRFCIPDWECFRPCALSLSLSGFPSTSRTEYERTVNSCAGMEEQEREQKCRMKKKEIRLGIEENSEMKFWLRWVDVHLLMMTRKDVRKTAIWGIRKLTELEIMKKGTRAKEGGWKGLKMIEVVVTLDD